MAAAQKYLEHCQNGEVIRLTLNDHTVAALVVRGENYFKICTLSDSTKFAAVDAYEDEYRTMKRQFENMTVLSYGLDWNIKISHEDEHISLKISGTSPTPGSLVVSGSDTVDNPMLVCLRQDDNRLLVRKSGEIKVRLHGPFTEFTQWSMTISADSNDVIVQR